MTQGGKIMEGIFAINKPQFLSSAQVLRDLQSHFGRSKLFAPTLQAEEERRAKEKSFQRRRRRDKGPVKVKIGHGGTLDPLATGVLVAGIGKGTKQLSAFLDCTKTYETVVLFGVATDTYDRLGKVIGRAPYGQITREKVEKALKSFHGRIKQRPPIYSALRIDGKRLYDYAREGKEIRGEIQSRPVGVDELELIEWMDGGQHSYRWPTEEAEVQDKFVAEEILRINNNTTSSSPTKSVTTEQTKGGAQDKPSSPKQKSSPPEIKVRNFSTTTDIKSTSSTSSPKRKREQIDSDDDLVFDAKHPRSRRKTSGWGPLMSGALPDPATIDGSSNLLTTNFHSEHKPAPSSLASVKPSSSVSNSDSKRISNFPSKPQPSLKSRTASKSASPPPPTSAPAARLRMTVSSGFYVRSLCHDLGMKLGSLGIMCELVRTRQAQFELGKGNVFEYADLEKGEEVWGRRIEALLDDWWRDQRKPDLEEVKGEKIENENEVEDGDGDGDREGDGKEEKKKKKGEAGA